MKMKAKRRRFAFIANYKKQVKTHLLVGLIKQGFKVSFPGKETAKILN